MLPLSDILNIVKFISSDQKAKEAEEKFKKVLDLYYNRHELSKNKEALCLLDSIGASSKPAFSEECLTAGVYYLKALFLAAQNDNDSAIYCLNVVDDIPLWRTLFGRETLKDIKEQAKLLKYELED